MPAHYARHEAVARNAVARYRHGQQLPRSGGCWFSRSGNPALTITPVGSVRSAGDGMLAGSQQRPADSVAAWRHQTRIP